MKAIILATVLCLLISSSAFSIGRPHNIFATHKAVVERVISQPKENTLTEKSILNDVSEKAQRSVEETRRVVSMIERIVIFFSKIFQ
ncbi:MAG: hypothetical protein R2822_00470 [Spirosomataceae bacterium]